MNEEVKLTFDCDSGMADKMEIWAVGETSAHIAITSEFEDLETSVLIGRSKVRELRDFLNKILGDE